MVFRVFCWLCDLLYFFLVDLVITRLWVVLFVGLGFEVGWIGGFGDGWCFWCGWF